MNRYRRRREASCLALLSGSPHGSTRMPMRHHGHAAITAIAVDHLISRSAAVTGHRAGMRRVLYSWRAEGE
jgi:hypothetical protein